MRSPVWGCNLWRNVCRDTGPPSHRPSAMHSKRASTSGTRNPAHQTSLSCRTAQLCRQGPIFCPCFGCLDWYSLRVAICCLHSCFHLDERLMRPPLSLLLHLWQLTCWNWTLHLQQLTPKSLNSTAPTLHHWQQTYWTSTLGSTLQSLVADQLQLHSPSIIYGKQLWSVGAWLNY